MGKKAKSIYQRSVGLKRVGLWATVWWGVSCLYVALLVWQARERYVSLSVSAQSEGFWSDWGSAIGRTYNGSAGLHLLLAAIVLVWIVGAWFWRRELRRQNISRKAAFKDLFLTIR